MSNLPQVSEVGIGNGLTVQSWKADDGEIIVGLRWACEQIGIDWSTQLQKLRKNPLFKDQLLHESILVGKQRRIVVGIPIDLFLAFLLSLNTALIGSRTAKHILAFQHEFYRSLGNLSNKENLLGRLFADCKNEKGDKEPKHGYIYLIKNNRSNMSKIGKTTNPKMRMKSLQTGSPSKLQIKHLWEVSDMKAVEETLHIRFSQSRQHGEWFKLEDGQYKSLISLMKTYECTRSAGIRRMYYMN